jgi:hypothetical protein
MYKGKGIVVCRYKGKDIVVCRYKGKDIVVSSLEAAVLNCNIKMVLFTS